MDEWLAFARGPFFRFTFAVMVLGLARSVIVTLWSVARARRLTEHKDVSWGRVAAQTVDWIVPLRHLRQHRLFSGLSVLFHIGVILTPILLWAHIQLIDANLGLSWWALPGGVADVLTLVTVGAALALLLSRLAGRASRVISRAQDWTLPALLTVPFLSGFLAAHPGVNPFPYDPTMLVHVLSGGVCFLVIPFTKLAHMALLPLTRLPSELAWRFPDSYPEAVARQVGKEGQPI
jgi:nitrate reductase gamma subunit